MEHGVNKSFRNLREVSSTLRHDISFHLSIKKKGALENKALNVQNSSLVFHLNLTKPHLQINMFLNT